MISRTRQGVRVDAQHVAIAERPVSGMPVFDRAVTPSALDDPDRGQVEHRSKTIRVDSYLTAEHSLQEGFLPLRTDLVAYRRDLVALTHGGEIGRLSLRA
jgi:hypothetical protein